MITKFDKPTAATFRVRVLQALEELAREEGLVVTSKGGTIDGTNFLMKIEFAVKTEAGTMTRKAMDFVRMAALIGMEPGDLFKTFEYPNGPMKIVGYAGRARKQPVICEAANGKQYCFATSAVRKALGRV